MRNELRRHYGYACRSQSEHVCVLRVLRASTYLFLSPVGLSERARDCARVCVTMAAHYETLNQLSGISF